MTQAESAGANILIVDDEPILRESIATYLEDSGFVVTQAGNGSEGLEKFRLSPPDLVLLDLRMPGLDGLEVLEILRTETPDTPVIVVTGAGVMEDAISALRLGAVEFVTKPIIDMEVLEHAIRNALEKSRLVVENRRYRDHLESEIQDRTADLETRRSELETTNSRLEAEMAERERTEVELRRSESRLAEIINLFEGFIYSVSNDFKLDFMNRKMADFLGSDGTGKICHRFIYNLDEPCPWCRIPDVFEGRSARLEIHSPIDSRWYFAVQSPRYDADGQVATGQTILIDFTDHKSAEEALQANEAHLLEENTRLRSSLKGSIRFGNIIGKSSPMQTVYETVLKASESDANVIIYGDSGTGKELVAHTIHELSRRGGRPFVTVHCGAIPDNLAESEFFGYIKGAFTGADVDKPGYLAAADGGTLFLDEVGELNLNMQVKLLRAIEGGGYTPIGGSEIRLPDFRIIAATNRDLNLGVKDGHLRKDFYYRIHIVPIHLPPLRDRKEDIPLLIHHFMQLYGDEEKRILTIPANVMRAMQQHDWPGNVRELQNTLHRYTTLGEIDFMPSASTPEEAVQERQSPPIGPLPDAVGLQEAIRNFEKAYIEHLLEEHRWHRSKVASILGIDRRTLFRKMKAHDL